MEHRRLSLASPRILDPLPPAERARALRLATETLRWAQRADRVLGPYLRKRPHPKVHALLRMAVWEICAAGAPPHAVTDAAVGAVRADPALGGQAGLVNAVLRRIGAAPPDWDALPVPELPKWLRKPLSDAYGRATVRAIEAAHARGAPIDVTPGPAAPGDLARRLDATVLPTGSLRLPGQPQVSALPGYAEGWWWVQDAASALPAICLDAAPGERVLDLCAAPGGKTMQLAAAGAHVTALDISEARVARLRENLDRTALPATVVVADALAWQADAPFDAVLLDAPCTATGTIRRHPDLPHLGGAGQDALTDLQARLIDRALTMLRPGGRLVFCTCSLLPAEGEDQVAAALARHPGLEPVPDAVRRNGIEAGWAVPGGGLRLRPDFWPELGGMDGFFIAVLRKPADPSG